MYDLPYYKEKDKETVLRFMQAHSFGMLICCTDNIPAATQVPFLIEERDDKLYLRGHIMRNTDHHKALMKNDTVLCLFTGAHSYVSARLYTDPQRGSTWNYMSVQARGKLRFVSTEELVTILYQTTNQYENDPASPSNFEHIPEEYVNGMAKAIEGFEIEITGIDTVFKLSQEKDKATYQRISDKLQNDGGDGAILAVEMKQRERDLFKS